MWKPVNVLAYAFGLWIYGIYLIYIQQDFTFLTPIAKPMAAFGYEGRLTPATLIDKFES
jgi:hypothetical protein